MTATHSGTALAPAGTSDVIGSEEDAMERRILVVGSCAIALIATFATARAAVATLQAQEAAERTAPVVPGLYDGRDQFSTYCASCHGAGAKGDGPVGLLLKRRPPDLTTFALRNGGTFDAELVYQIVDGRKPAKGHGGADMPVWGDAFSKSVDGSSPAAVKDRIDAIVKWLRSVQRKSE
jgi:mono/diheme cytochrome c family protein